MKTDTKLTKQKQVKRDWKHDDLQPNYRYLEKYVDGVRVRLHNYFSSRQYPFAVELDLGGQLPVKEFRTQKEALVYYDSVNHKVASIQKEIKRHADKIRELKLSVIERMNKAVFELTPLREDEVF